MLCALADEIARLKNEAIRQWNAISTSATRRQINAADGRVHVRVQRRAACSDDGDNDSDHDGNDDAPIADQHDHPGYDDTMAKLDVDPGGLAVSRARAQGRLGKFRHGLERRANWSNGHIHVGQVNVFDPDHPVVTASDWIGESIVDLRVVYTAAGFLPEHVTTDPYGNGPPRTDLGSTQRLKG